MKPLTNLNHGKIYDKINAVIDPEKNFTAEDQKGLQRLKDRLQSSNPNGSSNDEK